MAMQVPATMLLGWLLLACSEKVVVGYDVEPSLDGVAAAGGLSNNGRGGSSSGAEANQSTGLGGGPDTTSGSDLPAKGELVWQADFETGDVSQWEAEDQGGAYVDNDALYRVVTDHVYAGDYSLEAAVISIQSQLPQAMLLRDFDHVAAYYSAYYCVRDNYDTSFWVIMKFMGDGPFQGNSARDRFDIDLSRSETDDQLHLQLDEHGGDAILSPVPVPIDRWFRIEVFYRSSPADDGRLVVWQDGVEVLDIGERPTAPSSAVTLGVGVAAWRLNPLPASIWVDDVQVTSVQ